MPYTPPAGNLIDFNFGIGVYSPTPGYVAFDFSVGDEAASVTASGSGLLDFSGVTLAALGVTSTGDGVVPFSGSVVTADVFTALANGVFTVSGAADAQFTVLTYSARSLGRLAFSGEATGYFGTLIAIDVIADGSLQLSGGAVGSIPSTTSIQATGNLLIGGAVYAATGVSLSASGGITLEGAAQTPYFSAMTGVGLLALGGAGSLSKPASLSGFGRVTLIGAAFAEQKEVTYADAGGILFIYGDGEVFSAVDIDAVDITALIKNSTAFSRVKRESLYVI